MRIRFHVLTVHAVVGLCALAALASFGALPAHAQDYPYPVDEIASEMAMPVERFERWWSQAPGSMRTELLGLPLGKWGPAVMCDFLGFRIGTTEGVSCREQNYANRMATADQWNADGSYKGPSEQCQARNKTDKWGRLICD